MRLRKGVIQFCWCANIFKHGKQYKKIDIDSFSYHLYTVGHVAICACVQSSYIFYGIAQHLCDLRNMAAKDEAKDDKYDHNYHRVPGLDNVDREDFVAVQRTRDAYNRERFAYHLIL